LAQFWRNLIEHRFLILKGGSGGKLCVVYTLHPHIASDFVYGFVYDFVYGFERMRGDLHVFDGVKFSPGNP